MIAIDSDALVAEIKKLRGKANPLSAAALKALRDEDARTPAPAPPQSTSRSLEVCDEGEGLEATEYRQWANVGGWPGVQSSRGFTRQRLRADVGLAAEDQIPASVTGGHSRTSPRRCRASSSAAYRCDPLADNRSTRPRPRPQQPDRVASSGIPTTARPTDRGRSHTGWPFGLGMAWSRSRRVASQIESRSRPTHSKSWRTTTACSS